MPYHRLNVGKQEKPIKVEIKRKMTVNHDFYFLNGLNKIKKSTQSADYYKQIKFGK